MAGLNQFSPKTKHDESRRRPDIDLRLILLGTGNDAAMLHQRIDGTRPRGVLWLDQFVGDPSLIVRYLSAADIFAFPSRDEGFPVAPIEAMSAGLPCVAATAPGITDIFEGGEASGAVLVPVDDPAAFADALVRLIDDAALCEELGRRARRRALDGFSLDAIGPRLAALLTGTTNSVARAEPLRYP